MFGKRYVAGLATEFVRRHPRVAVDLLFVDRVANLVEEGVQLAVRIGRLADSSLVAVPVGVVRRVVVASPKYLRARGVPRRPEDLLAHACVRFTGLAPRGEWLFRVDGRERAVPITSVLSCNDGQSAIDACVAGLGLGAFLSYMVAPARRAGKLRYVLEGLETEPVPVNIVFPHARLVSANVRAFVDWCTERLRRNTFD
jgi:DNA-binding transcriptional LysR family regulator